MHGDNAFPAEVGLYTAGQSFTATLHSQRKVDCCWSIVHRDDAFRRRVELRLNGGSLDITYANQTSLVILWLLITKIDNSILNELGEQIHNDFARAW